MATNIRIKDAEIAKIMPIMQLVNAGVITKEEARIILVDEPTP